MSDRRHSSRSFLNEEQATNPMAIPGLRLAKREHDPKEAYNSLEGVAARVYDLTDPRAEAARAQPGDHQIVHEYRSKAKPEIARRAQGYDMEASSARMTWETQDKILSQKPDAESLDVAAEREMRSARAFYDISDRYAAFGKMASEGKSPNASMMGTALNQRAIVYNNIGISAEIRSVVAKDGLIGVMSRGNISAADAYTKVRKAGGLDLMDRNFLEHAASKGVDVKDMMKPEDFYKGAKENWNMSEQTTKLRMAVVDTLYPEHPSRAHDRDYRIKRAAAIRKVKDRAEGPATSKEALAFDEHLMKSGVMKQHPFMRSLTAIQNGAKDRQREMAAAKADRVQA